MRGAELAEVREHCDRLSAARTTGGRRRERVGRGAASCGGRTSDAIVGAARARDYDGLEALLDPATFSYSFGESGDPVGYWRRLEAEGHVPIFGDILTVVLATRFAKQDDTFVWPSGFAKAPSDWTAEDLEDLRQLYSDEDIRSFEQAGGYLGWRVGIREDGHRLLAASERRSEKADIGGR